MPRWQVALAGYYGFGNLGDELLLRASIEALERCGVRRGAVVALSNDPEGTRRDYGVAAVQRWSFREVSKTLLSCDSLLLGGGGLFQDSTSLRSCLWYWGLVRLARLCGARVWALGQSIGPLRRRAARWLARGALRSCGLLQLRDAPSLKWARRLGLDAVPGDDLALTLTPAPDLPLEPQHWLLLNLRPHPGLECFINAVAPHVETFAKEGEVVGVALSGEDEALLNQVRGEGRLAISQVVRPRTLEEAGPVWQGAAWAVGMRLHFGVLSALHGTPLALLPYDPKVRAFAGRAGVPCVDEGWEEPRVPRLPPRPQAEIDELIRSATVIPSRKPEIIPSSFCHMGSVRQSGAR